MRKRLFSRIGRDTSRSFGCLETTLSARLNAYTAAPPTRPPVTRHATTMSARHTAAGHPAGNSLPLEPLPLYFVRLPTSPIEARARFRLPAARAAVTASGVARTAAALAALDAFAAAAG